MQKHSSINYSSTNIGLREQTAQRGSLHRAMVAEFLKIILPLVLISGLGSVMFQIQGYRYEVEDLVSLGEASVRTNGEFVYSDFKDATADLRMLASSTALNRMLEKSSEQAKEDVARDFIAFAANKQKYDQIRYIDSQGMEVIRVNYNDGQPAVVPENELQNKSGRYYFQDTVKLAPGEVFVSPLDLNIEKGQIEQPRKPMIRFGTVLHDSSGSMRGILVINYLGDHFLEHLKNKLGQRGNDTMLLNAEGFWLLAPDPEDEWGFMFKNGRNFRERFPAAWQAFHQQAQGAHQDEKGIFAFAVIYPMLEGQVSSSGAAEAYAPSTGIRDQQDYSWILVSYTPERILREKQARHWRIGLLQYGLLLLVLVPLTLAFSWAHVRQRAADSLVEKLEQRMRDIARSLAVGLFVIDRNGRLSMMNPEAERLLGWSEEELYGQKIHTLICSGNKHSSGNPGVEASWCDFVHQESYRGDDLFYHKDGTGFHVTYSVSPLLIDDQSAGNVISFQDITDRKRMEIELARVATLDELTGLFNRRELNKRLDEEIRRAERYEQYFSIWMLDIDHFKRINDTYGHQEGDRALRIFAASLARMLRDTDISARFGGEEFVVILSHTSLEQAMQMAERVRVAISEMKFDLDGESRISITASIGVATYPQHGTTADTLIRAADQGLYAAKQSGRNQVRVI